MNSQAVSIYNTKEYKRARVSYVIEAAVENLIAALVTDTFLAKVLVTLGISDGAIGIISSISILSCVFQFISIFLVKKIKNVKRTVILFDTVGHSFFMTIYVTACIGGNVRFNTVVAVVGMLTAYFLKNAVGSVKFKWANSYVNPASRGEYSGIKEIVSLVTYMIFILVMGYMIEYYESINNLRTGFIIISLMLLVLNIGNVVFLALIKEHKTEEKEEELHISDILKNTLGRKSCRNVVIMVSAWKIAQYLSVGFMGVYKVNDLAISMGTIQLINTVANIARVLVTIPFGRLADKKSFAFCISVALSFVALSLLINVFTTPERWWLIIVYTIIYVSALAGIEQNMNNIMYSCVEDRYVVYAMIISSGISGLLGFLSSVVGSRILTAVQNNGNMVFGRPMYAQQLLSLISFVLIILVIIYNKTVVEKQKRII